MTDIAGVTVELPIITDIGIGLEMAMRQDVDGTYKSGEDLARYRAVVEDTSPQVIIETGTWAGGSAIWFAGLPGVEQVVSVDINSQAGRPSHDRVHWICGDSTDPAVVKEAVEVAAGRRTMVSLDSCHHPDHVWAELNLYGPLVTPGCYLVAEDGMILWMHEQAGWWETHENWPGPLPALDKWHDEHGQRWQRDRTVERMTPGTMFPAGWMLRR